VKQAFDSPALVRRLIAYRGIWIEFYVQQPDDTDRYTRNRANLFRIYVARTEYPIDITSQREEDGLIHCYGRWNEEGLTSKPSKETGL
jgi:hypothetical protein